MSPSPPIRGVIEAAVYAEDLDAAVEFYRGVLGLRLASDMRPVGVAMRVAEGQVLLVFDPRQSRLEGRPAPAHGCDGRGHVALRIDPPDLDAWRRRLAAAGTKIEREVAWPGRGRSIYVRDPGQNSVELLTADIWL